MKPFYTILTNPITGNYQTNFGAIRIELEQDYRKRIKQIEKFKKDVFHSLEGCVFDPLGDIKRVFRLPYSWRKYEGKWYIVQPKIHPIDKGQVMASPKTSMPLLASSFYIINRVGNRFFPLLHYKHQEFSKIINDASRLKDTYELGDYCLFVSKRDSYVTFNSLISKRRCEKIMKNSKCENKKAMLKFGKTLMRISNRVCEGKVVDFKPRLAVGVDEIGLDKLKRYLIKTTVSAKALL